MSRVSMRRGESPGGSSPARSLPLVARSSGYCDQMKNRNRLSHLDSRGRAKMVDVGHKPVTAREAHAEGFITLQRATIQAIADEKAPKGEVFGTARIAGIMAAKKCGELIPLCHPLGVESVEVT